MYILNFALACSAVIPSLIKSPLFLIHFINRPVEYSLVTLVTVMLLGRDCNM